MLALVLLLASAAQASFDESYAAKAVKLSIECVDKEHPNHYDRFYAAKKPREIHPSFFGCYDWHSAVHGHWSMLRVLHKFPGISEAVEIKKKLDAHLTAELMKAELAHFEKEKSFELPYGYGWFLRLVQELHQSPLPEAKVWRENVRPLEVTLAGRIPGALAKFTRPLREGMHLNSAYSLNHIWDYAKAVGDMKLSAAIADWAKKTYSKDVNCPIAYEPSGYDFISPCLAEAELMSRVLTAKEFKRWFGKFLPGKTKLEPVMPSDLKDPYIGHLIGLMFQRASSLQVIHKALGGSDPALLRAAKLHADTAWKLMFDSGYGGEHWLASFAFHYYTQVGL